MIDENKLIDDLRAYGELSGGIAKIFMEIAVDIVESQPKIKEDQE